MSESVRFGKIGSQSELLPLIELIYQTVEDASLWPAVLDEIGILLEGQAIVLIANYANSVAKNIAAVCGGDSATWKSYAEHYAAVNVWTERCDRMFLPGAVRYSHLAVPDRELEKTEFHADFLRPNDLQYGFGVEIVLGDHAPALLSAVRAGSSGSSSPYEGRIMEALLPHLKRALMLHAEFSQLRSNVGGLEAALDACGHAVFGLNRRGSVVFHNSAAQKIVQAGDGLRLARAGALRPPMLRPTRSCSF